MAIIGNGITTGAAGLDEMITVSDTQPTVPSNKVWVKETPGEIEIPTVDELEELKGEFESTVDYTESYNTVSGDIVSFDDGVAGKSLHKLLGTIEPVQDLHGYENPWPAGGGKNVMHPAISVTATDGISISNNNGKITLNGTAMSGNSVAITFEPMVIQTGYIMALMNSFTNATVYFLNGVTQVDYFSASAVNRVINAQSLSSLYGKTFTTLRILFSGNVTLSNANFSPMVVLDGEDIETWAPYENICPISGHTGVEVNVAGANVWDEEWVVQGTHINCKNNIPVHPNTEYAWVSPVQSANAFKFLDANGNTISTVYAINTGKFITPENCHYVWFGLASAYGTTYNNDVSINYPATDTEYHAYTGTTIPISWQSKAGTVYGGTVDPANGKLIATHAIVDLGTCVWDINTTYAPRFRAPAIRSLTKHYDSGVANIVCSKYSAVTPVQTAQGVTGIAIDGSGDVWIRDANYTSQDQLADFTASLSGVQLVYELATPIEYNLSSRAIKTLSGQNNVWIDTGSITECEYVTATSSVIDKLLPEATDEDIGKALLVKTVEDGRVTEYELGDVKEDLSNLAHVITDTASGDIATFTDGADNQPIQKLVATIEPVQDLHGYENPWPGGSTKNMFPVSDWFRAFNASSNYLLIGDTSIYLEAGTYTLSFEYYVDGATTTSSFWRTYSEQVTVVDVSKQIEYNALGLSTTTTTWTTVTQTFTLQQNGWLGIDDGQLRGGIHYRKIQVESGSEKTDFIPYSNVCPISGHTGMTVYDDPVYGGTINFNQLTVNGNFESTDGWLSGSGNISASGNRLTFTATNKSVYQYVYRSFTFAETQKKILIVADITVSEAQEIAFGNGSSIFGQTSLPANTRTTVAYLATNEVTFTSLYLYLGRTDGLSVGATAIVENVMFFDLTQMFGAGNEPSTYADFKALFPKAYYNYNSGEDTCVNAVNGGPHATIPITWQTEAGTIYGGTVTLNADWSVDVVAEYGQKELDGSSDETYSSYGTPVFFYTTGTWMNDMRSGNYQNGWCNLLDVASGAGNTNPNVRFGGGDQTVYIYLQGSVSGVTDVATFRTWLSSNPLQIVYPLATPQTYHFDNIGQLYTLLGINNVWTDVGEVSVDYPADTKLYIDNKIAEAIAAL